MKKILFVFSFLFTLHSSLFTGYCFSTKRLPETVIKIGIELKVKTFNLSCEGHYYIYEIGTGLKENIKPLNDYLISIKNGKISIDMMEYNSPLRVIPSSQADRVKINGKRYRDTIYIVIKNGVMNVVNEIGLEDYLYGVLPKEVSPEWGMESLKAQAVVSRSFVLKNIRRHEDDNFDLCDTVHCQVYGGVECENDRTNRAVEETRGMLLIYKDEIASGIFHACCGGKIESPAGVWQVGSDSMPYLKVHTCRYCSKAPHYSWKREISLDYMKKKLNGAGFNVGDIKNLKKGVKTASGRIKTFVIKHSKGSLEIQANKLRLILGPELLRSALIDYISRKSDKFIVSGRGWGHGVGLCQWGAKFMADKGKDYKDILKYYFPGTSIERWEE